MNKRKCANPVCDRFVKRKENQYCSSQCLADVVKSKRKPGKCEAIGCSSLAEHRRKYCGPHREAGWGRLSIPTMTVAHWMTMGLNPSQIAKKMGKTSYWVEGKLRSYNLFHKESPCEAAPPRSVAIALAFRLPPITLDDEENAKYFEQAINEHNQRKHG